MQLHAGLMDFKQKGRLDCEAGGAALESAREIFRNRPDSFLLCSLVSTNSWCFELVFGGSVKLVKLKIMLAI